MNVYSCLAKNLQVLGESCPDFVVWFKEWKNKWYQWENRVDFNRWGWLDLAIEDNKTLLGSMPPKTFYVGWKPQKQGIEGASIISGCNLGYGLNWLLSVTKEGHKIAVTDPHPEMLALCLGITDYSDLLYSKRIIFFPPDKNAQERVLSYMDVQFYHGHVYFWADVPSMQLGPEYELQNKNCRDVLQKYKVQTGTLRRKQDTVVGNELENYSRAFKDGVLNKIDGALQGGNALVLGAGPSLEEFGPQLASRPVNALYAAGLQTLPALARLGIKPDLCMAIDFTRALLNPFKKLDDDWLKDVPLIYTTKVHPEVVKRYPGPKAAVWTRGGLGTMVFKNRGYLLDTGGSVNVALVRLLTEMGMENIVFAGMDFGWKGDFSHARGHHASNMRKDNKSGKFEVRYNADKDIVYSALPYLTSLWELEKTVANKKSRFYNLFGGVMDISGAKRVALDEVYSFLGDKSGGYQGQLAGMQKKMRANSARPVFERRGKKWAVSLRRLMKRLDRLFMVPENNTRKIRQALAEMRLFVSQDPLYLTYLQPEIMDINALEIFNEKYVRSDYVRIKQLAGKVIKKVKRMDRAVGGKDMRSAA